MTSNTNFRIRLQLFMYDEPLIGICLDIVPDERSGTLNILLVFILNSVNRVLIRHEIGLRITDYGLRLTVHRTTVYTIHRTN